MTLFKFLMMISGANKQTLTEGERESKNISKKNYSSQFVSGKKSLFSVISVNTV